MRKEQGTQAAGFAIAPLFTAYFLLQTVCAFVAAATALSWRRLGPRVHWLRSVLVDLALIGALVGWWLDVKVSRLTDTRNAVMEVVLSSPQPTGEQVSAFETARTQFVTWHLISIFVNLVTILLVSVVMVLTAMLPVRGAGREGQPRVDPSAPEV
jgi:hypothetical protein